MPELLLCCALRCSHCRLFCTLRCCLLLLQLCLLLKQLRSSAFSPFFTGFCRFRNVHTSLAAIFLISLSPFFLHKLMRFLILSFNSLTWWSVWAKRCQFYCLLFYCLLFFIIRRYFSSIHECRNFFSVAHFCAAISDFSSRVGAAFYCSNFAHAFCSTTYGRAVSQLSLLGFVTFVFFTLRCHLFFLLRCHLFFFINSCSFSCYLPFLLPIETSGRNAVNSTACCCTDCRSRIYVNTFRPR